MAVDIKGYRVFIASPRGLEDERQKFFDTIQEYNRIEALPVNIQFVPVGWEYTLPGMGRPQSLINEEVKICDYFVLALWDRWGTPPDKDGKGQYSSGTEEEYHVALDCIGDTKYPMRQIVALFKAVDERRLNDPGPELQKVLNFKKELEEGKTILFKTFEGPVDFEKILRGLLGQWRRDGEQGKTAKVHKPEIPPTLEPSGGITEPEQNIKAETEQTREIVEQAEKLADEGKVTEAEEMFAKAVVSSGEPYAYNAYGIFLARVGRLGQAQVMYEKALDIAIKIGDEKSVAAYYGNLGLIYLTRGELNKAEEMHKKSLEISEKLGWLEGMASQYGNLGLIYETKGELGKAEEMHKKSLEINEKLGLLEGMANQYGNLSIIYGKRGELDKAEEMLKKSLEINEKLGLLEGMASQYGNLGVVYQTRGELDKAEEMHKKSLEINEKLGRREGMAIQYSNLGLIYAKRGDLGKAREYWEKARDLFKKIGMPNEVKKVEGLIEKIKEK